MSPRPGDFVHDIRIPIDFNNEPRFLRLTRLAGKCYILHVLTLWAWVASNSPSTGRLEGIAAEEILMICRCGADQGDFVDILLSCGYLAQDADGVFYVPNWRTEQPFAAQAEERSQAARAKAQKRWGTKTETQNTPEYCTSNATALQSECSNTNSKAFKSPPTPPRGRKGKVPVSEIVQIYADVLPELPQPNELTGKMHRDIEARWNAKPEQQSLEWWRKFFAKVRDCPFLMGENGTWSASLGWLVNRGCMDKVLGGEYLTRAEAERLANGGTCARVAESYTLEEFEQMQAQAGAEPTIGQDNR